MSSTKHFVVCALFSMAALCVAAASQAQSPLDGTWRVDLAQTKFSPKPLSFDLTRAGITAQAVATQPTTLQPTARIMRLSAILTTR